MKVVYAKYVTIYKQFSKSILEKQIKLLILGR
jgi:hypothetical protein